MITREEKMTFEPNALPTLIGSLPLSDHQEATRLILEYMPEIPLWAQLPGYPEERLLSQFTEGLPGIRGEGDSLHFDTEDPAFEQELLSFYEQYLGVTEAELSLKQSIFAFSDKTGRGFKAFLEAIPQVGSKPMALKGQITGPFTMLIGLKDKTGRLAFFNPQLREVIVKAIALRARYQVEEMKALGHEVILFLDEPALAGFGSSAMVGVTKEDVISDLTEVIDTVQQAGGIPGIHVCANTDWSVILETPVDILSFDAYGFFDRIVLYKEQLSDFLKKGKIIAWGLVPTLNEEDLEKEDVSSLKTLWDEDVKQLGADPEIVKRQALITPSCGTGLLSRELSIRVLTLTRDLSRVIRG
jgi:methionine synthase II (cobalamin-independent)